MQKNFTHLIIKYRHFIFITWVLLIIFSIWNIKFNKVENFETELTGVKNTEAYEIVEILDQEFNYRQGSTCAIVLEKKTDPELLAEPLKKRFPPIHRAVEIKNQKEHKYQLILVEFKKDFPFTKAQVMTEEIREFLDHWSAQNNNKAHLTGNSAFQQDAKTGAKKDSKNGEIFALLISFFILVYNFGALVSAFLPLIIGATTLIIYNALLIFFHLPVNPVSQILTGLVGLALAIDYSLFIISRFREELLEKSYEEALETTLKHTRKTIIFSALIMICSVSSLLIPNVSVSRTVVTGIMGVIAISLINSILFLPVFMIYARKILNKPEFIANYLNKRDKYSFWKQFSEHVVAHYKLYFILSTAILLLLSAPVFTIKLWEPVQSITPKDSESMRAYKMLEGDNWGGELVPVTIVIKSAQPYGVYSKDFIEFTYHFTEYIKHNPNVAGLQSITSWNPQFKKDDYTNFYSSALSLNMLSQQNQFPLINAKGDITIINIFPKHLMDLNETNDVLKNVREYAKNNQKYKILTGGVVARVKDFTRELYSYIPQMLLIILGGIYILLFFNMKSVILPIKAGIMNFLPILSSFGVLVLIFQYGFLSNIINTPVNHAVTNLVPIILFCITFGLSMDYEVFILSRINEVFEKTHDVKHSIIEGLAKSGAVITGAVLILLGVFLPGTFSSSPQTREICIGITAAIFIDATVVRLFLVPSFMVMMGKWNWWNPFGKVKGDGEEKIV
jgi:RND superfamily putative drug exporter